MSLSAVGQWEIASATPMAVVKVAVEVGIVKVVGIRLRTDLTPPPVAVAGVGTQPHLGTLSREVEVGISSRWPEGTLDGHMTVVTSLVGRMCILVKVMVEDT